MNWRSCSRMKWKRIETDRFECSDRERAAFEAGIKLGSLFHQFMGVPVSRSSRTSLEAAMREALMNQPHVISAEVNIDEKALDRALSDLDYCPLSDRMLKASVEIGVASSVCRAHLEWMEDMNYPLMWISSIGER